MKTAKKVFISFIFLVLYVTLITPIINTVLMPMFIDWINNSDLMVYNQSTVRYVFNETSGEYEPIETIKTYDLRPLLIFVMELAVYFAIPILVLWSVFH